LGIFCLVSSTDVIDCELEISAGTNKDSHRPTGAGNMPNPLRSIDRWASQSGERAALLLWLVVGAMAAFVVLAVLGLVWYTAPLPPTH
jgi:hypothetical protein